MRASIQDANLRTGRRARFAPQMCLFTQTTVAAWEQAARAARSARPQQAATLPAFSTRSRGRSAARVAESSRLPILDLSTPLPEGNGSSLPRRVLSGDQLPARREGPLERSSVVLEAKLVAALLVHDDASVGGDVVLDRANPRGHGDGRDVEGVAIRDV